MLFMLLDIHFFFLLPFFFFHDTATTEIYTLSLHDALPISIAIDIEVATSRVRAFYRRTFTTAERRWVNGRARDDEFKARWFYTRSEEHTSELQSQSNLVCRLLLEKKKNKNITA